MNPLKESRMEATRYLIVGAGPAGITAAEAIRQNDRTGRIVVTNGEPNLPYSRPLIVELLTGKRDLAEIALHESAWYEAERIELISGDPAVSLDPVGHRLTLASGRTFRFEKLLLATGSRPVTPPIPGLSEVRSHTLYRVEDAVALGALASPGARVLVVGIGLIGLQAIQALSELGARVTAVEAEPKVLPLILDREAAAIVRARMERHGVEVHVSTTIAGLEPGEKGGGVAITAGGDRLPFDFVVLAAGMKPAVSLATSAGLDVGRGIRVGQSMETSVADIYSAGDVVEYPNWIEKRPEVHAHWVNAYWQGRIAGLAMAGVAAPAYEPIFLNSLSVFGLPVITLGASRLDKPPEGAETFLRTSAMCPSYARVIVRRGKVVAATFIKDVDQAGVFQHLMREKVDVTGVARSLFEGGPQGVGFLTELHRSAVRGNVDWPSSMDLIDRYRKDMKRTRWGSGAGEVQ